MIVCPACNQSNPEGAPTCQYCGESLVQGFFRACSSCGALNPPERAFCSRCLSRLVSGAQVDKTKLPPADAAPPPPIVARSADQAAAPPNADLLRPADPVPDAVAQETNAEEPEAVEERWESDIQTVEDALLSLGDEAEQANAVAEDSIESSAEGPATPTTPSIIPTVPSTESPAPSIYEPAPPLISETAPESVEDPPAEATGSADTPSVPAVLESLPAALEGIETTLPLPPAVFMLGRGLASVPEPPDAEAEDAAELFHRIATEPARLAAPMRTLIRRPSDRLPRLGRTLLYLLVLLAALTPLFSGRQTQSLIAPGEAVSGLTRTLSALPAGSTVLISFDYGPGFAGELDPLAVAVTRFLASRSVRIVALTTRPEGVGLARRVLDAVAQETVDYAYGQDYAILGYLPGEEAGLRTLGLDFSETFRTDAVSQTALSELAVTRDLVDLQDAQRVLILAEDGQSVRRWIEQVGSRHDVALDALVTAAVEPMLMPYRQSGQLRTLVTAATGAAEFEVASGMQPDSARAADGLVALFLLLALIAVATNVAYVVRGDRDPSHATADEPGPPHRT
ncbi:MAG: zinc ribbon domain-containing protein [Anaerolineae bacterium]